MHYTHTNFFNGGASQQCIRKNAFTWCNLEKVFVTIESCEESLPAESYKPYMMKDISQNATLKDLNYIGLSSVNMRVSFFSKRSGCKISKCTQIKNLRCSKKEIVICLNLRGHGMIGELNIRMLK